MSELQAPKTTTAEVREFYSYGCGPQPTWEESQADFDVWLKEHDAEVERAAAEKAWREGELAGTRNQRDFQLYRDMKITDAEYKRREAGRANPYRREGNE